MWDLGNRFPYPWLTDHPEPGFLLGDYTAIKRNYLPEDYRLDSHGLNVVATVHIEAECDRARSVDETAWLHEIHRAHGMPNAVVAHAWLHDARLEERLLAHKKFPLVRGIRSKPVANGAGSLADPAWRRGMNLLAKHELSWDLRVPWDQLSAAASALEDAPELRVVLNHTGLPWDRSDEGLKVWRTGMKALAANPNVCCKISELGLKNSAWTVEGNRRVVLEAVEIFGPQRCMFGSNFPVASLRVSYRAQLTGLLRILSGLAASELRQIFRTTAERFYRPAMPSQP